MKKLEQISVLGLGLLGVSVTLSVSHLLSGVKTVGYSHRASTRDKAGKAGICDKVCDDICKSVADSDMVIVATPICVIPEIFKTIGGVLKKGCIVTDVGSTKVWPHRWAKKHLPIHVHYVGSHPIAGSEKRGLEFARDDLFDGARCILTKTKDTNTAALRTVKKFWEQLGCLISTMSPAVHDKIMSHVSHLPHATAASLLNSNSSEDLKFAGRGFLDTSRIASGPANVWTDILVTNSANTSRGLERLIKELRKLQSAIQNKDEKQISKLLTSAGQKRKALIDYKMRKKELL